MTCKFKIEELVFIAEADEMGITCLEFISSEIEVNPILTEGEPILTEEESKTAKSKLAASHLDELKKEIKEYMCGKRRDFNVPFHQSGTPFQERVWEELTKIPYGHTVTYSELAERIGRPKAVRAVANAVGDNSISILVPCHRVVAKGGIGGYAWGIEIKKTLLYKIEKTPVI